MRQLCSKLPIVKKLGSVPGFGPITSATLVAWFVRPERFKSLNAVSSYCGLGLGQGFTKWKPVGRTRASKRGNRELKRVLFIAARSAVNGQSALARRHSARLAMGWEKDKAIRDIARKQAFIAAAIMRTGEEYDDGCITVPAAPTGKH